MTDENILEQPVGGDKTRFLFADNKEQHNDQLFKVEVLSVEAQEILQGKQKGKLFPVYKVRKLDTGNTYELSAWSLESSEPFANAKELVGKILTLKPQLEKKTFYVESIEEAA